MVIKNQKSRFVSFFSHLLFWGFNIPLAFTVLNFVSISGWRLLQEDFRLSQLKMITEVIPLDILATLFLFFAMPIISVIVAVVTKSYRKPSTLLRVLFGVELPIMAFTLGRLFFLKTLSPVNIIFLGTAAISIFGYCLYLFRKPFHSKIAHLIHVLTHQAAVVVGLYASLLMFFFLPIVAVWMIEAISSFFKYQLLENFSFRYLNLWQIITGLVGTVSFGGLFVALVSSPFIGLFLYWRAAQRLSQGLRLKTSVHFPLITRWLFSLFYLLTTIFLAYQGSLIWFYQEMDSYKAATTFEERSSTATAILPRQKFVQNRLVYIYLSHYRYLTDREMTILQQLYQDQLKLEAPAAAQLQHWFTVVAYPFVYNGQFEQDVKSADKYYQDIFDEPIQLAQSEKVSSILATSFQFSGDQLKSSILDREDRDVYLVNKTITAQPDATRQFATITIEEEYENQTVSEQEVLYFFSLPQDSVITDLKLGADLELERDQLQTLSSVPVTQSPSSKDTSNPSASPAQNDQGVVAAKGAANQTFEAQYLRRLDPALLEQVGPVQYKLRIYPIPVKEEYMTEWQREQLASPVKNLKVRYSYVTALNSRGEAVLPNVSETRNIYGGSQNDEKTIQVLDRVAENCGTTSTQLVIENKTTLFIPHAVNPWLGEAGLTFDCQKQFAGAEEKISNKRIAILADASYSMGVENWKTYLETELPLKTMLTSNTIDVYFFNDLVSQPINLNTLADSNEALKQVAFGKTNRLQALKQVEGKYDLVMMFTDGSVADELATASNEPATSQPTYLIINKGAIPAFSDTLSTHLLGNGSRIASSGQEALQNFAVAQVVKQQFPEAFILVAEAGTWILSSQNMNEIATALKAQILSGNEPLAKLSTHRFIQSEIKNLSNTPDQLLVLDRLNQTAQKSGIVTPFSSFIVLVTAEQKEQLRQASLRNDRYVVNFDLGEEALIEPAAGGLLGTSAVPEPHEWVLLFAGLGLVAFLGRHRVQALLSHNHA